MAAEMITKTLEGSSGNRLVCDFVGDPSSPGVLLTHGGGQTRHSWHAALESLGSSGWYAGCLDLRGHGESDWVEDGDYRIEAFAADVDKVAREHFTSPPALVGASLGGISSLLAIGELNTPVSALVLVDVAPRMERDGVMRIGAFMTAYPDGFASLEEAADAVASYNPNRPRPKDLSGLKKNLREREDGRLIWHWDPRFVTGRFGDTDETRSMHNSTRLHDAARTLKIPVLLVRGKMSDLLSEEGARELLEMVPGAVMVDVSGAGHMVAGDKNDVFNAALIGFLRGL